MIFGKTNSKGSISIFLLIIVSVLMSQWVLFTGKAFKALKYSEVEKLMIACSDYSLAQYNSFLYERYGIFGYIDEVVQPEEVFKKYMDKNHLTEMGKSMEIEVKTDERLDMPNIFVREIQAFIIQYELIDAFESTEERIEKQEGSKGSKDASRKTKDMINKKFDPEEEVPQSDQEFKANMEDIKTYYEEKKKSKPPALSNKSVSKEDLIFTNKQMSKDEMKALESQLKTMKSYILPCYYQGVFHAYVEDKHKANYYDVNNESIQLSKKNGRLDYQIEYLISGKRSDKENYEYVRNRIYLILEGRNTVAFFSDSNKRQMIMEMGGACTNPVGLAAVVIFTTAWISAESYVEWTQLISGEGIAFPKKPSDWITDADGMMNHSLEVTETHSKSCSNSSDSQSSTEKKKKSKIDNKLFYSDYMLLLMELTNQKKLSLRAMDLMNMDIQSMSLGKYDLSNFVVAHTYYSKIEDSKNNKPITIEWKDGYTYQKE